MNFAAAPRKLTSSRIGARGAGYSRGMTDEPHDDNHATEPHDHSKAPSAPAFANPPQQNADVDVKTDGGVNDPAAK